MIQYFLLLANGELRLEGTVIQYHWLGLIMVLLIIAEFFLIFSRIGDNLFPALKKAKVKTRFWIWIVMVMADVVFIGGIKIKDILILIKGKI